MALLACGGCLKDIFVTEEEIIDRFTGQELWLWGRNNLISMFAEGKLGDGTVLNKSSPVQTISGGTNWRSVAVGYAHSAALKTDGSLWLWGCSGAGALGNNCTVPHSSPVQTISNGTNWRSISLHATNSAGTKTDGTLWSWGAGGAGGRLGNNCTTSRSSPVQTVSGGTNWKSVSIGSSVLALKTDGTLWLWGANSFGSLGDNSIIPKSSPVQTVSGGTNWRSIASGTFVSAASKNDGTLWIWGYNGFGSLGDNCTTHKSSPVQTISGGTNWKKAAIGNCLSVGAIKTDGSLWLWGAGAHGALGNSCITNQSSPVQTITGGTNWRAISVGLCQAAAIKTDGTLWAWGSGYCGALGINCLVNQSSPVQTISGGTNWRSVDTDTNTVLTTRLTEY